MLKVSYSQVSDGKQDGIEASLIKKFPLLVAQTVWAKRQKSIIEDDPLLGT